MILNEPDYQAGIDLVSEHLDTAKGRLKADLLTMRAGLRAEKDMAYQLKTYFATDDRIMVIHNLKVEHVGRTAQIDHLGLTRRGMHFIESKSISDSILVNEHREWFREFRGKETPIDSPALQNERHREVLMGLMDESREEFLGRVLGIRKGLGSYTPHLYVAISKHGRIQGAGRDLFSDTVMKYDQVASAIKEHLKRVDKGLLKSVLDSDDESFALLSQTELEALSDMLLRMNCADSPLAIVQGILAEHGVAQKPRNSPPPIPSAKRKARSAGPVCRHCSSADISIAHGRDGYYIKCRKCDGNTAIKETCSCGKQAKIRKEKDVYHLACPDCGDLRVYFTDTAPTPEAKPRICPKCGAEMVLRTAKRGKNKGQQFWGCSAYPKCKEIQEA